MRLMLIVIAGLCFGSVACNSTDRRTPVTTRTTTYQCLCDKDVEDCQGFGGTCRLGGCEGRCDKQHCRCPQP